MSSGLTVALFLAALATVLIATWSQQQTRMRCLRDIANCLEDGVCHIPPGLLARTNGAWVRGLLGGHRVGLSLDVTYIGRNKRVTLAYTADVPNAVADFTITKANLLNRLGRWAGLVKDLPTGDAEADDAFIVQSRWGAAKLEGLFRSGELTRALHALFGTQPSAKVELRLGILRIERRLYSNRDLDPGAVLGLLHALSRVASLCGRRKVEVKLSARERVDRFGFTGGGGEVICPYCRDQVDLDGDDVAACEACHTVHHAACLKEAGGCTVFGCSRQAPRRRA